MNRICEELKSAVALVPVSLATATDSTPVYIDCAEFTMVDFLISHGALESGKTVTVKVYAADNPSGTNATKVGETDFVAGGALTSGVYAASARISADKGRYYGVVIQHDKGSAMVVSGVAVGKVKYLPAKTPALII